MFVGKKENKNKTKKEENRREQEEENRRGKMLARGFFKRFRNTSTFQRQHVFGGVTAILLAGGLGCVFSEECQSSDGQGTYDVAIIGGGLVGLAIARELGVRGKRVVLLEKEDSFASGASSGNSGLGHTGYDAPLGSLESKILRRSIQLHQNIYRSFGLSHEHVRKSGSLVVAWTPEELARLPQVLEENRLAGDMDAQLLDQEELRELEPELDHTALGAVLCPYEAVVEPWLVPLGYAESARLHGATLLTRSRVVGAEFDSSHKTWKLDVCRQAGETSSPCRSLPGEILVRVDESSPEMITPPHQIQANVVINCAGLFGDHVERLRGDDEEKEEEIRITPRKGQFVVYEQLDRSPNIEGYGPEYIIEPVSSEFTKGVIAWRTVYGNIIVGPTAVNQESKTDRSTDWDTVKKLKKRGEEMLPCLKGAKVIGTYSGLRPASQYRDYQIHARANKNWITVAGIRSTGLTASSGLGEYVSDLYECTFDNKPRPDYYEDLVGVSEAVRSPEKLPTNVKSNGKVPTLHELSADYQRAGDGTVEIYGKRQQVKHAISSFGMGSLSTTQT